MGVGRRMGEGGSREYNVMVKRLVELHSRPSLPMSFVILSKSLNLCVPLSFYLLNGSSSYLKAERTRGAKACKILYQETGNLNKWKPEYIKCIIYFIYK